MTNSSLTSVTLGVADLGRATAFYVNGLAFTPLAFRGVDHEIGEGRFFHFGEMRLTLWPLTSMQADTGLALDTWAGAIVLGCSLASHEEVNERVRACTEAGGRLAVEPRMNFWGGYSGYVHDPDGHLWELSCDPGILRAT
jgi:catechol 2,3-dioxygenase-like lactoylglutathione lyase family enzyme